MLLSVDVGKGTEDIVLYDGEIVLKAILPSAATIIAKKIEKTDSDIVVGGHTMGGSPLTSAIKRYVETYNVFMTRKAALSLSDNIEKVKSWGIKIIEENEISRRRGKKIFLSDINMEKYERLLEGAGVSFSEINGFGLALQDHGFSLSSNRKNRFSIYERLLEKNGFLLQKLYFRRVPPFFNRAHDAMSQVSLRRKLFMDSSYAAILGAYLACGNCCAVNVGNAHTLAALIVKGEIWGLFEHHTHLLNASLLKGYLRLLFSGKLKYEDIFDSGGHGAFMRKSKKLPLVITGPQRKMIEKTNLDFTYAYPLGDSMIPGNLALIKTMEKLSWH